MDWKPSVDKDHSTDISDELIDNLNNIVSEMTDISDELIEISFAFSTEL